jgi:hypothetical protein
MAVTYITSSDITDQVVAAATSQVTAKLLLVESAVNDMAERKGVQSTDIYTTTIHYQIKKWCVAWVCQQICLDLMGVNNVEMPDIEKYKIKYDLYTELLNSHEESITYEILTNSTQDNFSRAISSGDLYRG